MKRYFLLAAATLALAACNNDDNYNNVDDPVAAHITATIGESAVTRASGTSWAAGDQIGITMDDRYVNMEYTTESTDGKFTGTTMYFKNKREPVTLIAYYPFAGEEGTAQTSITASTTADRQTPKNQPKIDFLYATKENVTGSDPNVNLTFSHKMSKLTFTFKEGNKGTNVGKITSYEIGGLVLDGTFNAVTGVCAAKSDAAAAPLRITMPEGTVVHNESVDPLILFPQTPGKVTLKITDSEAQEYACELNFGNDGIVAGNNYQYTITVSKTGLTVNSNIADWNDEKLESEAKSDDSDDSDD